MRYCSDPYLEHKAYQNYIQLCIRCIKGKKVHVYVDGETFKDVILADEDQGYVVIPKKNNSGSLLIGDDGNIMTEIVHGRVEVRVE